MKKKEEYFFDPNNLPAGEKKYYEKMVPIINGLLNDIRDSGCLRIPSGIETAFLVEILSDKDEIGLASNRLHSIFSNKKTINAFVERNKDYLGSSDISYLYISMLYFLSLLHAEMFRNVLLFYTRKGKKQPFGNKKMTLGRFFYELKKISPTNACLIAKELEPFIRNSFAHGLFSIIHEKGKGALILCHESVDDLTKPTRIPLDELMIKSKKFNILYATLMTEIAKKIEDGYFRQFV